MAARCELTELPVTDCAHCRPVPDPSTASDRGPWFTADYPGRCADCGDDIDPGDQIRADGSGGYLGECCRNN